VTVLVTDVTGPNKQLPAYEQKESYTPQGLVDKEKAEAAAAAAAKADNVHQFPKQGRPDRKPKQDKPKEWLDPRRFGRLLQIIDGVIARADQYEPKELLAFFRDLETNAMLGLALPQCQQEASKQEQGS
jgi:hypothetical protein